MQKRSLQKSINGKDEEVVLAFERTLLSQERTLMAWVRTSLSMIGFGFTIFRIFSELKADNLLPGGNDAAQNFGIILVILGTVFLVAASIQHKMIEKELAVEGVTKKLSLPFLAAICVSLLGIVMLFGIFFHLGPLD